MTERSPLENERNLEAACNNLIDVEFDAENGKNIRQISPQDNTDKPSQVTQNTPRFTDPPSLKDTNECKYIDQANLHRASLCSRRMTDKEGTQTIQRELNESDGDKKDETATENKELLAETPSETEKEEGNYEELICLVRQFYVERPVNPAAIAYQNIETC